VHTGLQVSTGIDSGYDLCRHETHKRRDTQTHRQTDRQLFTGYTTEQDGGGTVSVRFN